MKTIPIEDAVKMIPDGASLMIGGFMGVGTPERIIDELVRQGKKDSRLLQTTQQFQDVASENSSVRA
jgi:acyl CoA:acetate/3-ketoacid CoA transferase alpha subunit